MTHEQCGLWNSFGQQFELSFNFYDCDFRVTSPVASDIDNTALRLAMLRNCWVIINVPCIRIHSFQLRDRARLTKPVQIPEVGVVPIGPLPYSDSIWSKSSMTRDSNVDSLGLGDNCSIYLFDWVYHTGGRCCVLGELPRLTC